MRANWLVVSLVLVFGVRTQGQSTAVKSEDEFKKEYAQAEVFRHKNDFVDALPLYEDLYRQRPSSTAMAERLAAALLGAAPNATPEERAAMRERATKLLQQCKDAGDDSGLVKILMEVLQQTSGTTGQAAVAPLGHEYVDQAEGKFSKGDLAGAVELYAKALEVNPQYYAAALFAGDGEYKLGHSAEAGKWFARAIAINPDIETAHRYWGDCLEKAGEHKRAEEEFIAAIVADPYSQRPRVGLKQWADANHAMVAPPPIKLPARATAGKDGKINIMMSPGQGDAEGAMDLAYSMGSAVWQGGEFKKNFPDEKVYRHSLKEETQSIRVMLSVAKEQKIPEAKLSTSTKLLMELDKNGMLECWILLDDADNGIAQDYVAYRKDHRELMAKYIAQYDVHAM
jgi:tetratricopeptide (TPR) repeat protein